MGYTNYFNQKENIRIKGITPLDLEVEFSAAKQEIRQLIYYVQTQKRDVVLEYTYSPSIIDFNGDSREGLEHENFYLPETYERLVNMGFTFCKTCRKPYDVVVVAAMCIMKSHLYNVIEISSDGYGKNYIDDEIYEGYALYKQFKKQGINPYTLTLKKLFTS